jgi:hypothetical protein
MKRIKLLSVALVIAVAGALHAAARVQGATGVRARADKPACCKAHKAGDKKAEGKSCDMAGGDCGCKSHAATKQAAKTSDRGGCACCDSGCCAHDKKGTQACTAGAGGGKGDGASCCADCSCCGARQTARH